MDINKYKPEYHIPLKHLSSLASVSQEDIFEFLYTAKLLKQKFIAGENILPLKNKVAGLMSDWEW
jgi:hypothetical protein